jgi:hypothetical protein
MLPAGKCSSTYHCLNGSCCMGVAALHQTVQDQQQSAGKAALSLLLVMLLCRKILSTRVLAAVLQGSSVRMLHVTNKGSCLGLTLRQLACCMAY